MNNLERFNKAKFTRSSQINSQVKKIEKNQARYGTVEKVTGVPWDVIAVIHYRESSGSFTGVLHNGQKIIGNGKKTTIVPKGRGPFSTWEEAAIDALMNCHPYAGKNKDWSIGSTLDLLEAYNGLGYKKKGLPSPYLWAGTDQYTKGKYVSDGKYDPEHVDTQLGVAALLLKLRENKEEALTTIDPEEPTQEMISKIQELLRVKGYPEVGTVDGKMGNRTRNSILSFEADNNLPLTGKVTDQLLIALIKAPMRVVAAERATATKEDLKEAPSIKQANWLVNIGKGLLAFTGLGAMLEGGTEAVDVVESVNKVNSLWGAVSAVSPWLIGIGAGSVIIYFGSNFIKEQVKAYREGRHV